ncbi:class I SAM-dependent methyltransferase [Phreatobacter stygius]|uniref:Class I SAM-dependent methyltransferase n=1 Tax=Phreatobacter stygius TaxID=1940610 RepID=A0A4D7AU28_9HYPH|nr:class I SAM-dependent methyltransferase [Phreatobacter stygius]QCI63145.1 class I SAM-dependent methyltransferase [Phreatobacter stygius]
MEPASTFQASDGDGYELLMGRWSRRLAVPFLAFAGTAGGERVLDVGCGTGSLAFLLAGQAGLGEICGVDYAAPYVAHAARLNVDPRLSFQVADACALPFPDAAFDRVLSLLMLHFVATPDRAVAEMRRVARPGATVAAAVWDARGGFVANRMFYDTAAALDPAAAVRRAHHLTRPMTRQGELLAAWHQAGFADIRATELTIRMDFASFDDYWAPYTGKDGPVADYVATLDAPAYARLHEAVRAAYLDGETDGARSYVAVARAVKGTAP